MAGLNLFLVTRRATRGSSCVTRRNGPNDTLSAHVKQSGVWGPDRESGLEISGCEQKGVGGTQAGSAQRQEALGRTPHEVHLEMDENSVAVHAAASLWL